MDESEFKDVEDQLEPLTSTPRESVPWAGILIGFWAIVLVIFSVQNAEDATVEFLAWSFNMPVALLVIVTALVTLVIALIGSAFYRRRRRKEAERRMKQAEDRQQDQESDD